MSPSKLQSHHAPAETRKFSHVEIVVAPKAIESEPEHSDDPPTCNYTVLRRRPSNSWTIEQRRALCVLRRWYDNSWAELAKVFNVHFVSDAPAEYSSLKMTGSALATQLHNMQLLGRNREAFESVFIETLFVDELGAWSVTRRELERTAEKAGIVLIRRLAEDRGELLQKCDEGARSVKRKKPLCGIDSVLGTLAYESEEEDLMPEKPKKQQRYLTPSPSPQKWFATRTWTNGGLYSSVNHLPATPQSLGKSSRVEPSPQEVFCPSLSQEQVDQLPRPQIVFRFYNDNSSGTNGPTGMRAGLFQDSRAKVASPPGIDSEAFRKEAAKHFSWTREPTPFISTYKSILPVLHRALLSTIEASIAVIDLQTVGKQGNHSKVYDGAHIMKRLGLRQEAHGYRAISEWLVWGMIEKDAIVATFSIKHLRKFLAGSPDVCIVLRFPAIESSKNAKEYREKLEGNANQVGRASGRVVGKYLAFTGIPPSYIEKAAKKIARDWQLTGNGSVPRLRRYMEGVQLGLRETGERRSTKAKAKQRLAEYLKQVDADIQRERAEEVPLQAKPKPWMTEYLRRVDCGLKRKRVELRSPRGRNPRRRLASYLERVDFGLGHTDNPSTNAAEASDQGVTCDDFLSRRRHIEAVCSGL